MIRLLMTPLRKLWKIFLKNVNQKKLFEGNDSIDSVSYYKCSHRFIILNFFLKF